MDEKDYSQMQKDFYEVYRTEILPIAKKFEKVRIYVLGFAIAVPALLFFGVWLFCKIKHCYCDGIVYFLIFMMSVSFFCFVKKSFENEFKSLIMTAVCKCFGDLHWEKGIYSDVSVIKKSKVVPYFSKAYFDDVFKGSFKNVKYEIIEAKFASLRTNKDNTDEEVTVFKGVVIRFDMNKNFNGHTIICQKNIIPFFSSDKITHKTMEDANFEKMYNVITDDENEAGQLLTTFFKERLINIKNVFMSGNLSCVFYKNSFFIALETQKDLFSLCSLFTPVDDFKQIFTLYEEIVSVIKLIDYFKLEQESCS